jgi:hypothetical protein
MGPVARLPQAGRIGASCIGGAGTMMGDIVAA